MPSLTRRPGASARPWILILLGAAGVCGVVLAIRTSTAVHRTNQLMGLARQLNSGPPESRTNAAIALSSVPASDISLLIRAAQRPNSFLEQPLQAKPPPLPPFVRRWLLSNFQPFSIPGDRQAALRALTLLGTNVPARVFLEALADPIPETAAVAATALGELGSGAVPGLISALNSPSEQVRAEAARALGIMGPNAPSAAPPLSRLLSDQSPYVAGCAAYALGRMGTNALPALIEVLQSPSSTPAARQHALESFEHMAFHARVAIDAIAVATADPDPLIRARAANTLASVRAAHPTSQKALSRLLADPDASVRSIAAISISRAGQHARTAIPTLESVAASDPDPSVRSNAIKAIKAIRAASPSEGPTR